MQVDLFAGKDTIILDAILLLPPLWLPALANSFMLEPISLNWNLASVCLRSEWEETVWHWLHMPDPASPLVERQ